MDGYKLLEAMSQKGIEIPLIFLTACDKEENEMRSSKLGAVDYIRKPINKKLLLPRIKNALEICRWKPPRRLAENYVRNEKE